MRDGESPTKQQEVLQRGDGAERDVVAGKRRQAPDDDGRTEVIRTISLTKARRKKTNTIGVDDHERRTAAQRRQFRGATR